MRAPKPFFPELKGVSHPMRRNSGTTAQKIYPHIPRDGAFSWQEIGRAKYFSWSTHVVVRSDSALRACAKSVLEVVQVSLH